MKKFFYLLSIILLLLSSLFPHLTFAESNTNSNEPKITEEEAADETVEAQEQDQMEELDEAELIEEELNEEKVLEDSSAEDKDVDNKSSGSNEPEKIEDEKDKDSESKERDSEEGIEVDDIEESEAEEEEKKLNTLMEQSITGEQSVSKLGHLKQNAEIFKELGKPNSKINSTNYTNAVYYIKKQATVNGEKYYLISTQPSSSKGIIGWVKSSQMDVHEHVGVDSKKKEMLVTGDGKAFSKAWGGNKDLVYNLSSYKGQTFTVNKTERVGNNIWYRGKLNGEQVFIHESYVNEVEEKETSKLGHLKSNTEIYKQLGNPNSKIDNSSYLNAVYYIKKEAEIGKEIYYLISTEASSTSGTIGWVKSSQMDVHEHVGVDSKKKEMLVTGDGKAFSKAWGGNKDLVYNLSSYKGQTFTVNKTERVGNNIWYRGQLGGKEVFIHESYVNEVEEKETSKLGHLKSNTEIYKQLGNPNSKIDNSSYLNAVYYIKKAAVIGKETYYLISTEASSTNGTIGWVKSSQINIHDHTGVDKETKVFTVKGEGQAYTKAWGGSKDRVYNLSNYKDQVFIVNKTERVGN
ncbi:GW dipeptide domain-containing protein, partial [Oceanobacillus neutriphilus]|uniref:GW dipeptide domain-containing protein n=1 Tax=Oceanobacillus neutriphilus TaxID=531815 RepID=UPI00166B3417